MLKIKYRVYDLDGNLVMEGTSVEIKERFNLKKSVNLAQYVWLEMLLQNKYRVERVGRKDKTYDELLDRQIKLFIHERCDKVSGYGKDIKRNVADLADRGIKVQVHESVRRNGKRKIKYYVLEREAM